MSEFAERYTAHVRLAILLRLIEPPEGDRRRRFLLDVLASMPGGAVTASLLHEAAAAVAPPPSRDLVVTDLAWLGEQKLVAFAAARGVEGATLLARGRDVVEGRVSVPGVAPLPSVDWVMDGLRQISLAVPRTDLLDHLFWMIGEDLIDLHGDDGQEVVKLRSRGRAVAMGRDVCAGVKTASHETIMRVAANAARAGLEG